MADQNAPFSSILETLTNPVEPNPDTALRSDFLQNLTGAPDTPSMTAEKQAKVARASEAKKLLLNGNTRLATAILEGNDLGSSPLAQDLATGQLSDIRNRYGDEIAANAEALRTEMRRIEGVQNRGRIREDIAQDTGLGITAGAIAGLGGIAGLGAGLVNEDAGAFIAEQTNRAASYVRSGQSDTLQQKKEAGAVRAQLDQEDIDRQYEDDVAAGKKYPGLRRFGREAVAAAQDLWENPALAGDLTAEGLGSFVASGGVNSIAAKGVAKVVLKSRGLTGQAAKEFLQTAEGTKFMRDLSVRSMPASIGALEGGGAYAQIQGEIQAMSEEELMEAPEYAEMRASGMSHEEARNRIANQAALEGGAIQSVVGALSGTLVAKLEANPLKLGSGVKRNFSETLSDFGGDVLKETTEEAVQSLSGEYVAGSAIQRHADPDRDPLQGLGKAVIDGAVAGAGMAGVIRAPRLAADAAGNVVGAGAELAQQRLDSVNQQLDDASVVGDRATVQAMQDLQQATSELAAAQAETTPEPTAPVEETAEETVPESSENTAPVQTTLEERVAEASELSDSDLDLMPQSVADVAFPTGEVTSYGRMDAILPVYQALAEGNLDPEAESTASLWIWDQAKKLEALRDEDFSATPEQFQSHMTATQQAVDTILENPTIVAAVEKAQSEVTKAASLPEVTSDNVETPEVREAVRKQALLAKANPAGVDAKFIDQILDQAKRGKIQFSDSVKRRLQAAGEIAKAASRADEEKAALAEETQQALSRSGQKTKPVKTRDMVRAEVMRKGKGDNHNQLGLSAHLREVVTHLSTGNMAAAQSSIDHLGNFAQHMINKHAAAQQSFRLGRGSDNTVKYRTWTGTQWAEPESEMANGIYVNPFSPNSVQTAKEVAIDTRTAVDLYNSLLTIYGGQLTGNTLSFESSAAPLKVQIEDAAPVNNPETSQESSPAPKKEKTSVDTVESPSPAGKPADESKATTAEGKPEAEAETASGEGTGGAAEGDDAGTAVERLNAKHSDKEFTAATLDQDTAVRDGVSAIEEFSGLVLNDLVSEVATVSSDKVTGFANWGSGVLALNEKVIQNLTDPENLHVLVHEIGHLLDKKLGGDDLQSIQSGLFSSKKKGALYQEIADQMKQNDKVKSAFSYAMSFANDKVKSSELFAELFTYVLMYPERSKEILPNGTEYIESIIRQETGADPVWADRGTGQSTARSADGNGEPVGDSTQSAFEGSAQNLLKDANGKSRLTEAFTFNSERSQALDVESPVDGIQAITANFSQHEKDLALDYAVDAAAAKDFGDFVSNHAGKLIQSMNARLTKRLSTLRNGKFSVLEAIENGIDVTRLKEFRNTNLIDTTTGAYNKQLIEAAALGALHWVMNQSNEGALDTEKVAEIFSVAETEVTQQMMWAANRGLTATVARESLAKSIMQFWGAERSKDAPLSDTQGIAEGLAAEFLVAMEGTFIDKQQITLERARSDDADAVVDVTRPYSVQIGHKATEETVQGFGNMSGMLADILIPTREQDFYLDQIPEGEVKRQKGNMIGQVSKKVQDAVQKHRETPFLLNTPFHDLMLALGQDTYMRILGYENFDEKLTHTKHAESINGKNTNLARAWKKTNEHIERIKHVAERDGKSPEEVATHFDWFVASNDRIMAKGFSGQSDKTMREAVVSTFSTLDMTTDEGKAAFWLTVAQSIGVKTELSTARKNINTTKKEIRTKFPNSKKILTNWVKKGGELSADDAAVIERELKDSGENTAKALHALLAVARYEVAKSRRGKHLTEFKHALALEADGKTDGPINAMMHFLTGEFTLEQLQNLRKGGFYPNEIGTTLNEHFETDKEGDLYQAAANRFSTYLEGMFAHVKGSDAEAQFTSMINMLVNFGDLVMEENGDITIGRNVLKNPLTITVYGSGDTGMASKVAAAATDVIYARISEVLQDAAAEGRQATVSDFENMPEYPSFAQDLANLMTRKAVYGTKKKKWFAISTLGQGNAKRRVELNFRGDLKDFEFSRDNMEMFRENVKTLFIAPMITAIDETTGGARRTTKLVETSTQIRGAVFQEHFRNAVSKAVREAREKGELDPNGVINEKTYNEIYREMAKYGAVVESVSGSKLDSFHVNLSGSKATESDYEFARGMSNEYSGNSRLPAPRDVGVGGTPLLTISRGDARMMVNYYASKDPELRTLQVYDGLEVAADLIEKVSEQINQASAEAWFGSNPVRDESNSMADFLRQDPMNGLKDWQTLEAIYRSANGVIAGTRDAFNEYRAEAEAEIRKRGHKDPSDLARPKKSDIDAWNKALSAEIFKAMGKRPLELMQQIADSLEEKALDTEARKQVLSEMTYSADHMASGEKAYVHEGKIYDVLNDEDLLRIMNDRLEEIKEGQKKETEAKTVAAPIQEPDAEMIEVIDRFREDNGVALMSQRNLRYLLETLNLTGDQKVLADQLLRVLPDFSVAFGDAKTLTQFRNDNFADRKDEPAIQHGQTDLRHGMIYVANQAPETLLHELLHAATSLTVFDYYENPDKLSDDQKAAVSNLAGMMEQFKHLDFSNESYGLQEAASILKDEISAYELRDTNVGRAAALQEFVAWTLTNQNLAEALKKTKARSKLTQIKNAVVKGLKRMLGLPAGQSIDVFSNVLWNTGVLLKLEGKKRPAPGLLLNQLSTDPDRGRLESLYNWFEGSIAHHLRTRNPRYSPNEELKIRNVADNAWARITRAGFILDPYQATVFRSIQAAMASSMEMDHAALVRAQDVFNEVIGKLKPEHFMEGEPGPDELPGDRMHANMKFDAIVEEIATETDGYGRSTLLSTFIALSQVDPEFRQILSKIRLDDAPGINTKTLDDRLRSTANRLMTQLSMSVADGATKSTTAGKSLDVLSKVLAEIEKDDRTVLERTSNSLLTEGDAKVSQFMKKAGQFLTDFAGTPEDRRIRDDQATRSEKVRSALRSGAALAAGLVDEERGAASARAAQSLTNAMTETVRPLTELIHEVIGMTDENRGVYRMVNEVKYAVSATRQDYRETLPEVIAEQFSETLTDEQWSAMHHGLARANVAALVEGQHSGNILGILKSPESHNAALLRAEEELASVSNAPRELIDAWMRKAEELAEFMMKKELNNHNLLKNSYAIMNMFGEPERELAMAHMSEATEASLERMVALIAIGKTPGHVDQTLASLAQNESNGIDFTIQYLNALRKNEKEKATTHLARINAYEGYVPTESQGGHKVIVADDRDGAMLAAQGYTRTGDYRGSGLERGRKGYYFSKVGGNQTFNQGVMQTVHKAVGGVDPRTGRTLTGNTAGAVPSFRVLEIKDRIQRGQGNTNGERLIPIYSETGEVVTYERSMFSEQLAHLGPKTHLGNMIGAWAGRQVEEKLADEMNGRLIDELKSVWDKGQRDGRQDEFVNLADPELKDEVYKDAWGMIPPETRDKISETFGESGFMVRKDMVNNAVGYRSISAGEAWTGASRMNEQTKKIIKDATTLVLGKDAYQATVSAEKILQGVVSEAKRLIVIKSVIVPASNLASNVMQLMVNGVAGRDILKGFKTKLIEIEHHQKSRRRMAELDAQIARYANDRFKLKKLQAERQALLDASKRMSIWPLIEAGEFTTISEGLTEADTDESIFQGRWADKMRELGERLPAKFGTAGRYAWVTKDTALFQGMNRAVQYGDFLGKAVLYDHLTKREGKSPEDALARITEEFVNYNLLPGQVRSYAESMGLIWFWNFKLRSIKVAHRHLRDHPLRALLSAVGMPWMPEMPGVDIGSPLTDNALSVAADGRAGYSVGWGMGLNAGNLNPWVNLFR